MQHHRLVVPPLAMLAALLAAPAILEAAAPPAGPGQAPVAAPRAIECHCRANGRAYQLGDRVCLPTPSGHRVAECRMVQNVTSWSFGGEDCSVSAGLGRCSSGAAPTATATRLNRPLTSGPASCGSAFLLAGGVGHGPSQPRRPDRRASCYCCSFTSVLAGIDAVRDPLRRWPATRRSAPPNCVGSGSSSPRSRPRHPAGDHDQPRWLRTLTPARTSRTAAAAPRPGTVARL